MNTSFLTNHCQIIVDFERQILSNGETGDQRQTLACAPTTEGYVAWYLCGNGDDTPIAVQTLDCINWGADGFGHESGGVEWLNDAEVKSWLHADAIREAVVNTESKNIREFAEALEGFQEEE